MLCNIIAIPKDIPKLTSKEVDIKVIIPSGILWSIIAIIEIIPTLYKWWLYLLETEVSIKKENNIPIKIKIKTITITKKPL